MIEIIREETLKEREERRKKESGAKKGQADDKRMKGRIKDQKEDATETGNEHYEESQWENHGLPKNIRQIGDNNSIEKIYIEDYVMTHMKQLAAYGDEKPKVLILYGKREIIDGQLFWFISGAVQAEAIDSFMDKIAFDEKLWVQINETANRFFKGLAILGWAFLKKNNDSYWDEMISSTHKKFFRPDQKIFFEYIMNERIENMYLFENGKMDKQPGFYIYYERNEAMQNYMLAYKEEETERAEEFTGDQATKQFRAIVQEKKEQMRRRHTMGLLYGTSAILVMVIMVIGITMLNNYEKMQNMEKVLYEISGQMEDVQMVEAEEDVANREMADAVGQPEENDVVETTAKIITKSPDDAEAGIVDNGETADDTNSAVNEETAANLSDAASQEAAALPNDATGEEVTDSDSVPEEENTTLPENGNQDMETLNEAADSGQAAEEAAASIPKEYVIQKGDTLVKISRKFYGTDNMIQKICELNHIQDMDNILYGEKILLP
ncbi:MAG: LysM peptidoglycan-binding domain-containing protein [Lachnospiraceae bacterium]|nr:LysM peptidoglycan-binding domain-containing protein [Lachnospiraceae bacterium]